MRYPVIPSLCGYWRQVGRYSLERLLWSIRITSFQNYPNHRSGDRRRQERGGWEPKPFSPFSSTGPGARRQFRLC